MARTETVDAVPAAQASPPPSVHVRVLATWLGIFPLVSIGLLLLEPIAGGWHPVLRALVLTAVVVPVAVYLVVPRILRLLTHVVARAAAR